jgi:hypothetical protein
MIPKFLNEMWTAPDSVGRSFVAVDAIRRRSRTVDFDSAKKTRAGPVLAVAGNLGKVPDSFLVAGRSWKPVVVVTRLRKNKCQPVCCDGAGQPALQAINHAHAY